MEILDREIFVENFLDESHVLKTFESLIFFLTSSDPIIFSLAIRTG